MNEQDVLHWLFQLIVDHVEKTDENGRPVRRLEATGEVLDLFTKSGRHFRILVRNPSAASVRGRDIESAPSRSSNKGIHLPRSDWETLVEACESMLQYLKSLPEREMRDA